MFCERDGATWRPDSAAMNFVPWDLTRFQMCNRPSDDQKVGGGQLKGGSICHTQEKQWRGSEGSPEASGKHHKKINRLETSVAQEIFRQQKQMACGLDPCPNPGISGLMAG